MVAWELQPTVAENAENAKNAENAEWIEGIPALALLNKVVAVVDSVGHRHCVVEPMG